MSQFGKHAAKLVTAALLFGYSFTAAEAFQLSEPPATSQVSTSAVSFAGNGNGSAKAGGILSAREVQHVEWCATRYSSYHATDNSFAAKSGQRQLCRSPFGAVAW